MIWLQEMNQKTMKLLQKRWLDFTADLVRQSHKAIRSGFSPIIDLLPAVQQNQIQLDFLTNFKNSWMTVRVGPNPHGLQPWHNSAVARRWDLETWTATSSISAHVGCTIAGAADGRSH
jgi:hypothetical protein